MALEMRDPKRSRRLTLILFAVACVLQAGLAPQVDVLGGRVNVMAALVLALSFTFSPREAVYLGFFSGLFFDLTQPVPLGLMTLLLTACSFALSSMSRGTLGGLNGGTVRIACVASFALNAVYAICLLLLGQATDVLYAIGVHGFASAVLDAAMSLPFLFFSTQGDSSLGFSAKGAGRKGSGTRFKSPKSLK